MRDYLRLRRGMLLAGASFFVFMNFYLLVLCSTRLFWEDLIYLDVLTAAGFGMAVFWDYRGWRRREQELQELRLEQEEDRTRIRRLEDELQELRDYSTRWAHEVKLPLSSLKLMNARNQDDELAAGMQDCIERMQQQLNTMLMSCKLKKLENDVKFEWLDLKEIFREALKNQSYFLIREHFEISIEVKAERVCSDRRWLVYILDQLIANAVKYHREKPALRLAACEVFGAGAGEAQGIRLQIADSGIGILPEDLPYVFDKGYIGRNLRDGDYRSTGMGLYFVKQACGRLGIRIRVESKPGEETVFSLLIRKEEAFYLLS